MPSGFTYSAYAASPLLLQSSVQIALDYLDRAGEIDDYAEACQFLVNNVEVMMRQGQQNKLVLANRAIGAFERERNARTIELTAV
jgi:predicted RNA-binding protein with EMAP domain